MFRASRRLKLRPHRRAGMWFQRMQLEVWFDEWQFKTTHDIGESAVKFLAVKDLQLDLADVGLRYGHHAGGPELRAAIADWHGVGAADVCVVGGASEANFCVVSALVKPGDHVIVEHPNYPSLYEVPRSLGCDVDLFALRFDAGWRPNVEALKAMVTPKTKLISLTHPNNPTGAMMSAAQLRDVARFCEARGIVLLFDETYRAMDFANSLPSAPTLGPNCVAISSMSKCYGLPGIRIGWVACTNAALIRDMVAIREQLSICNNALGEHIALHVLRERDAFLAKCERQIASNRRLVDEWMRDHPNVEWVPPVCGVVGLPRFKAHVAVDPDQVYQLLADKYKTFCIPGRQFEMDNRYFRIGFGAHPEEVVQGLRNFDLATEEVLGRAA